MKMRIGAHDLTHPRMLPLRRRLHVSVLYSPKLLFYIER